MDAENNFDSDSSDSWSLIDMNCENSSEITVRDEIDAGIREINPQELMISEKSLTFPGEQAENGLPENITDDDANVASASDHLENQEDFQVLFESKVFEDDCDLEANSIAMMEFKCNELILDEAGKIKSASNDIDIDTDGISVISESEYNDIKATAYESDEVWDEKRSDSDGIEKPQLYAWRRKRKHQRLDYKESSEESVNGDLIIDDEYPPKTISLKRSDNGTPKTLYRIAPAYDHYNNKIANSMLILAIGIIFTGMVCIAIGHFLGVQDSQEAAVDMAYALRKLQKENILLHTRLTKLSRAVFAREVNKPELKEEREPPPIEEDKEENETVKEPDSEITYTDTERFFKNGIFHHIEFQDYSVPIVDRRNAFLLEDIDSGKEVLVFTKDDTEPAIPFNLTRFLGNLKPDKSFGRIFNIANTFVKDPVSNQIEKFEADENVMIFDNVYEEHGSIFQDGETAKENCLAVNEKDLSEFRRFLLNPKPKCTDTETEGLKSYIEPEYFYKVPLLEENYKKYLEELDDLDAGIIPPNVLEERDDVLPFPSNEKSVGLSYVIETIPDNDGYEEAKVRNDYFIYDKNLRRKKGKTEKLSAKLAAEYTDRYLKYFETVNSHLKKRNGKIKECIKKKDGKCKEKLLKKNEIKMPSSEHYKKKTKKRSKDVGKYKDYKKYQYPNVNKDETNTHSEKWETCSIKPTLKYGNESECENNSHKSGEWFSKWAEGRERCRRDQKISDWQFDRAKSRAQSREGDALWQFSRARGRQNRRKHPHIRKKKDKDTPDKEEYSFVLYS